MFLTPRFWMLLACGVLLAVLAAIAHITPLIVLLYDVVLVSFAIADFSMMPRSGEFELSRSHDPALSIGVQNLVELTIMNRSRTQWDVVLRDEPPADTRWDERHFLLTLKPRSEQTVRYHVTADRRGDYAFNDAFVRCVSSMKLWNRDYRIPLRESVKVYPNLLALRQYDLLKQRGRLREMGIRRSRLRGAGSEFESLRDFTQDDEYRKIDWKATARRKKPIVREYEVERSQSVFLLIDAGRNMLAQVGALRKLDHVMNSALMLAYAASSANDRIGLLIFNDAPLRYIPPNRGRAQVETILEALHGVQAEAVEPDYPLALGYLGNRWRKRSLVVVFTDLQEPQGSTGLIQGLIALAKTHLCICVCVSDPSLNEMVTKDIKFEQDVYQKAVALQVRHDRQSAIRLLEQKGIVVVDSEPEKLSSDLVNSYLRIKARSSI